MNDHKLTNKQFLFCEHYIQTSNATLSARLAGYSGKDDKAYGGIGSRLLGNVSIRAYLADRYKEFAMTSDEVLMRLANIARASLTDYCDEHGTVNWEKVAKDGYALKSMKRGGKLEFESKLRALELIGRAHAMFTDKIAPTDPTGTKEYGADTRNDLISKLLPGIAAKATGGETEEADD